jgi:hypothetical protein
MRTSFSFFIISSYPLFPTFFFLRGVPMKSHLFVLIFSHSILLTFSPSPSLSSPSGDKDILHTVMHWTLQRFDHLQKRAYLAKFLMPVEVPPEFRGEDLIEELCQTLKVMQTDFKGKCASAFILQRLLGPWTCSNSSCDRNAITGRLQSDLEAIPKQ